MQREAVISAVLVIALCGGAAAADHTAVEVGMTGTQLPNNALNQNKIYLDEDQALMGRIGCLMQDVDELLAKLHALPPESAGKPVLERGPVDAELNSLIELGLENSPELKPMRTNLAVLAARTRQKGALMDPMLSLMLMDLPTAALPVSHSFKNNMMSKASFSLSQTFESYGKRKLMRRIEQLNENVAEQEIAAMEQKLAGEISDLYFEMLATNAKLKVMGLNIDLMQLLLDLSQSKYGLGKTPQAAVVSAQVSLTKMEEQRLEMAQMLDEQRSMLAAMLGLPPGFDASKLKLAADYPLPQEVTLDVEALLADAHKLLPDFKRLDTVKQQNQYMLEMAKRQYRPDYTLTAGYDLFFRTQDTVNAGVMIPLSLNKAENQDAKVQESYAMVKMAEDEAASRETMLRGTIATTQVELKRRRQLIELYQNGLVPQARLALDSNIAGYAANMMDLSDLLMAQQTLLDAEQALEENYISYLAALQKLHLETGGAFDATPYLAPQAGRAELKPIEEPPTPSGAEELSPETPFVESLQLPEGKNEEDGQMPGGKTPPPEGGKMGPGKNGKGSGDDFYAPFKPQKPKDAR